MASLKFLALFALLLSFSLAVLADTSNEAAHAKDDVKPSEATDAIEPQQRRGCRYGCCGSYAFGRCSACCSRPQAVEAKTEANEVVVTKDEVKPSEESDTIKPQQRRGCRYGCCGAYAYGQCAACCSQPQVSEAETEASNVVASKDEVNPSEATDVVEPQQRGRGGCRYGCCGSYAFGRCSACCPRKVATEEEKQKEEAKP